jgi:hypothetical protein
VARICKAPFFKINSDMLNDLTVYRMSNREYCQQFEAALRGEKVYLSKFVRPDWGRPSVYAWTKLRKATFERDNYTCTYCGERGGKLECDHIIPVAKGGTHDPENLTTACFKCNRSKRDKTLEEWRVA